MNETTSAVVDQRLHHVEGILTAAGYGQFVGDLVVADVAFEFDAIYSSPDLAALIVVVDLEAGSVERASQLTWKMDRLGQALDLAGSVKNLTVIVVSTNVPSSRTVNDLMRLARVLLVSGDNPIDIERQVLPLLPLDLSIRTQPREDPMARLRAEVVSIDGIKLINASDQGQVAVRDALASILDEAFNEVEEQL